MLFIAASVLVTVQDCIGVLVFFFNPVNKINLP